MSWAGLPDDTVVLTIECAGGFAPERIVHIRATSFATLDGAILCGEAEDSAPAFDPKHTAELLTGVVWMGGILDLEKQHLAGLHVPEAPVVLVEVEFAGGSYSHAYIEWLDLGESGAGSEGMGFTILLRSWHIDGHEESVAACKQIECLGCTLQLLAEPPARERAFFAGGPGPQGFNYTDQVRTLLLLQEFGQKVVFEGDEMFDDDVLNTTAHDDDLLVTVITSRPSHKRRTTYVRMLPPGVRGGVSIETLADALAGTEPPRGPWVQWYPVFQAVKGADPVTGSAGGATRLYDYLRAVGASWQGRVDAVILVSHAAIGGTGSVADEDVSKSHFRPRSGGRPPVAEGILRAFRDDGLFWITGCNSQTGNRIGRKAIRQIEGTFRARNRLIWRLRRAMDMLDESPPRLAQAQTHMQATCTEGEIVNPGTRHEAAYRPWQLPGGAGDEGILLDPEARDTGGKGAAILDLVDPDTGTSVRTLLRHLGQWASLSAPSESDTLMTRANVEAVVNALRWPTFKDLEVEGEVDTTTKDQSLEQWVNDTIAAMSSENHCAAAFAWFAKRGKRDLRSHGGNPGIDGQHAKVTIELEGTLPDGTVTVASMGGLWEMSVYFKQRGYSKYCREWMRAYYARFGQEEVDALGYFPYHDKVDLAGAYVNPVFTPTGPDDPPIDIDMFPPVRKRSFGAP